MQVQCKFSGWCLQPEDCGDHDAHPHVLHCAQVQRGVDALFPQMPTFEKIHKKRCRERTRNYINNEVETNIREQVREQVRQLDPDLLYMFLVFSASLSFVHDS